MSEQQAPPSIANTGEDVITRDIDVEPENFASEFGSLQEAYEVDMTVDEIQQGKYQRIALQFPDELLHDSVQVYRLLRQRLAEEIELYVLADTTYGSCCVDEVAAQHVDADLIVHYGHTCLSPTMRLPVIYVLTKRPIDPHHAAGSLASTSKDSLEDRKAIVLMYDVAYAHKAQQVYEELRLLVDLPVSLSRLDRRVNLSKKGKQPSMEASTSNEVTASSPLEVEVPEAEESTPPDGVSDLAPAPTPEGLVPSEVFSNEKTRSRIQFELPDQVGIDECAIFYLGGESLALNNLLMTHGRCQVWSYDPISRASRLESGKTNRMLMRRYATVEKAKDADVVGILVGTLGVASYLPLIKHLRELIAAHQKKSYTVAVGKLNPAKLANFMEVECFVLVACPENTLISSKEFLRPIVTPFEFELALTGKNWTGDYVLDFEELLRSSEFGQDFVDPSRDDVDEEGPVFSSVTGKYRHPKRYQAKGVADADDLAAQASALSIRNQSSAVAQVLGSAAGDFLSTRTYRGLEPRYGMDAPAVIEQGREGGIARSYGYEGRSEEK